MITALITTKVWAKYNSALYAAEQKSRTANIIGDYAEDIVAKVTGGKVGKNDQKGFDVLVDNVRIQVKATRQDAPPYRGNTSDIHNQCFDKIVGVVFGKQGEVRKVVEIQKEDAIRISYQRKDGSRVIPWKKLVSEGRDITELYTHVVL